MINDFYYTVTVVLLEILTLNMLHWKHGTFLKSPINKYMTLSKGNKRAEIIVSFLPWFKNDYSYIWKPISLKIF